MLIKLDEYKMHLQENEIAKNTIKNYMNTLEQFEDYLKANNIETIEKQHLINYKAMLREEEYAPGRKYKISTLNQKIIAINVYFNWIKGTTEHELKLKTFKEQTKNHKESISENDFRRLRNHAKVLDKEIDMFMMLIANTGLRISEACALKKSDLNKGMIEIENKGKSRTIDIPPFFKKQLVAWDHVKKIGEDDCIFSKTQQHYRNRLKAIAGIAKVNKEKVYPHSFRHYFAKQFIINDGDSSDLQQMLGHSSITTTTIYTRKNKEELAKIYRKKVRNE